jgi:hypothetical protein
LKSFAVGFLSVLLTKLSGKTEELAGVLQQRYGYGKAQAETEISAWLDKKNKNVKK